MEIYNEDLVVVLPSPLSLPYPIDSGAKDHVWGEEFCQLLSLR